MFRLAGCCGQAGSGDRVAGPSDPISAGRSRIRISGPDNPMKMSPRLSAVLRSTTAFFLASSSINSRVYKTADTHGLLHLSTSNKCFYHHHKMGSDQSGSPIPKNEQEWKLKLTPEQFRILREKGTEMAGSGTYDKHMPDQGIYECAGCSAPLYRFDHKFKSGCGWPAFFDAFPGAVNRHEDRAFGMLRTEITCSRCGGHLGHVFKGEKYPTPTDERHCVNSVSIKFNDKLSADEVPLKKS